MWQWHVHPHEQSLTAVRTGRITNVTFKFMGSMVVLTRKRDGCGKWGDGGEVETVETGDRRIRSLESPSCSTNEDSRLLVKGGRVQNSQ